MEHFPQQLEGELGCIVSPQLAASRHRAAQLQLEQQLAARHATGGRLLVLVAGEA